MTEPRFLGKPETVKTLEKLGRVQLSKSFFMREFLYSEISQIYGIQNTPDAPNLAIKTGKNLCENILEPLQEQLGRISIRSAYRAYDVNAKGAEKNNQYNCAANDDAGHIWDRRDQNNYMGATACVVVTSFLPYYERTGDWTALAWWIHDHFRDSYARMEFFPTYAAFNITWHENPRYPKSIWSYIRDPHTGRIKGYLTKHGMDNFSGSHEQFYAEFVQELNLHC
ncbi:peptidase M15 [Cyanobacteria bacterium FACHB-63]|nr:peptidase M15 [Cyanobacteria bacterium FACHB-63]